MDPAPPKEDKDFSLPKGCYFNDGERKIDFVLVYPKLNEQIREHHTQMQRDQFIHFVEEKGLVVEHEVGKHHTTLIFLKIHGPHEVLARYAAVYNIGLTCQNPYYKYQEKVLECLESVLTNPKPSSEVYRRANITLKIHRKTLSGLRPTDFTSAERSKIVAEILKRISFKFNDDELTLKMMLDKEIFLQAYPIHDGDYGWTESGDLTDRQLLYEYWANFKNMFREQPISLIQKYYGPNVAFYFAFVNMYTKMLFIPAILGTICVIAGFVMFYTEGQLLEKEVCKSELVLCSNQKLKSSCTLMKLAYLVDNPMTIFYMSVCCFWGTVFWSLWQRRQAMLRLRWNLTSVKVDRTMRQEFQTMARVRKSSITGELEYYIPKTRKFVAAVFSYLIVLIMLFIFLMMNFLVAEYRFLLRKSIDYDEVSYANELELFSSSIIIASIILIINRFCGVILNLHFKIIRFLTMLRIPRSQAQYDRMYLHMTFIIAFANHFSPLFYLGYVRGFFHTYPGDISKNPIIARVQQDLCKPSGCLIDLSMQLLTIMVLQTFTKCTINLVQYLVAPWKKYAIPKEKEQFCGQWEKDFAKRELNQSVINELYVDIMLQYGFITFFNSALPIIGIIALVHNLVKIHHDAFRFLKLYRRPVIKSVPDIQGWNDIVRIVTIMGIISNAFVMSFRTEFIRRVVYRRSHNDTLDGYVNSTLSAFSTGDFDVDEQKNASFCYYRSNRFPPDHENRYQYTIQYWQYFSVRAIYFIILENFTLLLSLALGYLIPEVPRKVKVKLEHDEKILKAAREAQMEANI